MENAAKICFQSDDILLTWQVVASCTEEENIFTPKDETYLRYQAPHLSQ